MSTANRSYGQFLVPIKQTDSSDAVAGSGRGKRVLALSTTYYVELPGAGNASLESVQVEWDASVIVTIQPETTNLDPKLSPVTSIVAGEWILENPSTATVSVTSTDGTTGGATVSGTVVTVAGGTQGGTTYHIGNFGTLRARLKLLVGGTGGTVRVTAHSKVAA